MESILVINSGSTSIKYKLFTLSKLEEMQAGEAPMDHRADAKRAFKKVLRQVGDVSDIRAIGHRVVHGGSAFTEAVLIDAGVLSQLLPLNELAPLHNPHNLGGINAAREYLPDVPNGAVFDTTWYKDMPDLARMYPLPRVLMERYHLRKYGFHGISHQWAAEEAATQLKKPLRTLNLITIHLGGGCSATAVRDGVAVDTSMGFTPLEGLMMQTRAGDLDPGLVLYLAKRGVDLERQLNFDSGIAGVSGASDYLVLLEAVKQKRPEAVLALDMFVYRIRKYLGAYAAVLGRVDAVVFTGKIGAGEAVTRTRAMQGMVSIMGNARTLVVPPDEELVIAREARKLISE